MTIAEDNNALGPRPVYLFSAVGLVWVALWAIALTGYPNLVQNNERRVGAYVLDAVQNGHWICQYDSTGRICSKPPLLTWIASLSTLAFGRINRFSIYLPSAVATLGVAWTILAVGSKRFGWLAGLLGALAYLLSPVGDKMVVTARYDGLLALPVMLGALAAFRAWNSGKGWTWFWVLAAVATMVKGPLGLLLAAGGLLAVFWERRSGERLPLRGSHWLGLALYLLIPGGWFVWAYREMGQPLIDTMLGKELIGAVVEDGSGRAPGGGFFNPPWNVFANFLPWSLFTAIGLWRVCRRPSPEARVRRFERFLACWFFFGLLPFCIAAHQNARLIYPLIPVAALLAGRELSCWFSGWKAVTVMRTAFATSLIALSFLVVYHHGLSRRSRFVRETLALKAIAGTIREKVGEQFPLTHMDDPYEIQFWLNTLRPSVSPAVAAGLLRGPAAAFIMVTDFPALQEALGTNSPSPIELYRWTTSREEEVRMVSNHPRLEWTDHMATIVGPISLRMDNIRLMYASEKELVFEPLSSAATDTASGAVSLSNISDRKIMLNVRTTGDHPVVNEDVELAPGEKRQVTIRQQPVKRNQAARSSFGMGSQRAFEARCSSKSSLVNCCCNPESAVDCGVGWHSLGNLAGQIRFRHERFHAENRPL